MASASFAASDSRATLVELHRFTIHELLILVEGLYSNIDDGLFELADRDPEGVRRERCFNLMREMRFRRTSLVSNFTGSMQSLSRFWFVDETWEPIVLTQNDDLADQIKSLTGKADAHFSGLLRMITERACHATSVDSKALQELPIGPSAISQCFVLSCRSLRMDDESIDLVLHLFSRFVLDRLGQVYARANTMLRDASYLTLGELEMAASAHSA